MALQAGQEGVSLVASQGKGTRHYRSIDELTIHERGQVLELEAGFDEQQLRHLRHRLWEELCPRPLDPCIGLLRPLRIERRGNG